MKKLTTFEKALQRFFDEYSEYGDAKEAMIEEINVFLKKWNKDDHGVMDKDEEIDDLEEIMGKVVEKIEEKSK